MGMNMKKQLPQFLILFFFLILVIHLYAIGAQMPTIRIITKCLLLPLLMIYLILSTPTIKLVNIKRLALVALFFSWLGDVLLIQDGNFFLLGMVAFMMAHVRNGMLLVRLQAFQLKNATWIGLGLALGTIGIVYFYLQYSLGSLLVPVVTYMVVIAAVWVLSFNLYNQPHYKEVAYYYFIPGMFLFVLSDGILACNKFLLHQPERWDIWVMLTYAGAQLLLTLGYVKVLSYQLAVNEAHK